MNITIETGSGNLIDVVDDVSEVDNKFYILRKDVPALLRRVEELGLEYVTGAAVKLLIREGLMHKRE